MFEEDRWINIYLSLTNNINRINLISLLSHWVDIKTIMNRSTRPLINLG